jgi:hypothetical protein
MVRGPPGLQSTLDVGRGLRLRFYEQHFPVGGNPGNAWTCGVPCGFFLTLCAWVALPSAIYTLVEHKPELHRVGGADAAQVLLSSISASIPQDLEVWVVNGTATWRAVGVQQQQQEEGIRSGDTGAHIHGDTWEEAESAAAAVEVSAGGGGQEEEQADGLLFPSGRSGQQLLPPGAARLAKGAASSGAGPPRRVGFPRPYYAMFELSLADGVGPLVWDYCMESYLQWLEPSFVPDARGIHVATPVEFAVGEVVDVRIRGQSDWSTGGAKVVSVEPKNKLKDFNYTLIWAGEKLDGGQGNVDSSTPSSSPVSSDDTMGDKAGQAEKAQALARHRMLDATVRHTTPPSMSSFHSLPCSFQWSGS